MKKNKYYAYFLLSGQQGVCGNWADCEKKVKGAQGARFQGFKTKEEAEDWLRKGASYKLKVKRILGPGVYFDAGTGRGRGVEINVTDEFSKSLLHKVLPAELIHSKFGTHLAPKNATNNYGELLACYYALQIAIKEKRLKVFGDSKLVIDYWSRRRRNKKILPKATLDLISGVYRLRLKFKKSGGEVLYISGDDNPADLGFHR